MVLTFTLELAWKLTVGNKKKRKSSKEREEAYPFEDSALSL